MNDDIRKRISDFIRDNLKETRLRHVHGVAGEAVRLAELYGADPEKAELASLFHDMYKNISVDEMNDLIRKWGLPERYLGNNNLAHGKLAAEAMRRDYGITDEDLINAVSFHTTGRRGMSRLEKIIYLADAIEPGRDYPTVEVARKTAREGLDRGCLCCLERSVDFLRMKGEAIDSDTMEAIEELKEKVDL